MKQVLFVGCGEGAELVAYAREHRAHITGLEPRQESYSRALVKCMGTGEISIYNTSIQRMAASCGRDRLAAFDEIICVFPAPLILLEECRDILEAVHLLLKKGGVFTIYTEAEADGGQKTDLGGICLRSFLWRARADGWQVHIQTCDTTWAETFVRRSECGQMFIANGLGKITEVTLTEEGN